MNFERLIVVWLAIIPLAARRAFALSNARFTTGPGNARRAGIVTRTSPNIYFINFSHEGSEQQAFFPTYFDPVSPDTGIKGGTSTAAPFSQPMASIICSLSTNPFRTFGSLYA